MKKIITFLSLMLLIVSSANAQNSNDIAKKHTKAYIKQRISAMYERYQNPKYDSHGMRVMKHNNVNYDDVYCSSRYKALMAQAEKALGDDEILLDYDHWTNSQDDNDFTCQIKDIRDLTNTSAIVELSANNFGNEYSIILRLHFERNDWYVDDFLSQEADESEQEYFRRIINNHSRSDE